jgi:uncharacterized protein (DUF1800 family)
MALTAAAAAKALLALQRFGLGPKPGGIGRIGKDPLKALQNDLNSGSAISDSSLPTYVQAAASGQNSFEEAYAIFQKECQARFSKQLQPEIGFLERLVLFWSNHFSMSAWKSNTVLGTIGQWERDVVRKNVLGKFSDMLIGTMRHPAMIAFLDNENSMGPNSPIGQSWGMGYNENLAREILELHTLGVGAGYTELDVTNLAKIITGWSYVRGWEADNKWNGGNQQNRGQFIFRSDWHEPGAITVLGKSYTQSGIDQGLTVLRDLAIHPKTAEHIAYKLVLHFISDSPTPEMVNPLKTAFLNSGGNLKSTALALIKLSAALTGTPSKIRTPYELTVAQFRASKVTTWGDREWAVSEPLRALNHMPFERQTPDGYPDETAWWLNPDAMTIRLDTAQLFYDVFWWKTAPVPATLGTQLFDVALSARSKALLAQTTDKRNGLTSLLMLPEFQRR